MADVAGVATSPIRRRATVLIHIVTVPDSLGFLVEQVRGANARGFEVHIVSSPGTLLDEFARREPVVVHPVTMRRRITPLADLAALARLWWLLRRLRPRIVHAHTPKAGLLGMIAARLVGVPVRLYNMLGLPLETASGSRRLLLACSERVACLAASHVYSISRSLERVIHELGICPPGKIRVLGEGGSFGIDAERRFHPERFGAAERSAERARLGIPEGAPVVGFVGRLVRDKGVAELLAAWRYLRDEFPDSRLLVAGPFEDHDPLPEAVREGLATDDRIVLTGHSGDPAPLYAVIDLLVLPTYREGFGTVILEAGAMGLPVVATRVTGCVDAVEEGVTGTLVPARDPGALADAIRAYLRDGALRREHGRNGRARVLRHFRFERINELTFGEYEARLRELAQPAPGGVFARRTKRLGDVAASAAGLLVLAPLLLLVTLAIWIVLGRPVLFRQVRAGHRGRLFTLQKFRTMRDAHGPDGAPLPDEERLTTFGRLLRRSSLDELPQLWNVLRGEMSLVGPRPLLPEYLPLYTPEQARRHEVVPGLTGWAQVRGRNALNWPMRLAADVWYVDHWSLKLDVTILIMTLVKVFTGEGVSRAGMVSMSRFSGNPGGDV